MKARLLIPLVASVIPLAVFAEQRLSHAMPNGAMAYAELNGLGAKIVQLRDSEYFKQLMESPMMVEAKKQEKYAKAMAGKKFVETYFSMDLWTLAEKLLSEIAVGLYPQKDEDPAPVVMLRVQDPEAWAKVRANLNTFFVLADEKVKRRTKGTLEFINLENKLHLVFHKEWVVASTKESLLEPSVAGLTGKVSGSISGNATFLEMEQALGAKQMGRAWADLKAFRANKGERLNVPEKYDNGFVALILSGIIELGLKSDSLGLALNLDEGGMQLMTFIDGNPKELDDKFGWFFSDAKKPGTRDLPTLPGLMAGLTIHRDIAGWYDKREDLLVEKLLPGFDKFESNIGNLFPGRDVGKDLIPTFGKSITVLAAEQTFDYLDGEPGIKLPGFAVIIDLNKQEDAAMFQLVFQTVVTILNFAGAEDGKMMRGPSVMTAVVHNNTPISTIKLLQKPKGDQLHISYNFMPSAATVNDRFVFTSSLALCKALVDDIKKPQDTERLNRNFNFELHPNALTPLIKANRRTLLAKSIQKGKTAEEAHSEINLLQTILDYVKLIRLHTS